MMKKLIAMLLALALLLGGLTALAGGDAWTCPDCGQENEGNFCSNCGAARPAVNWTCPDCGQENEGNFCSNCGAKRPEGGQAAPSGEGRTEASGGVVQDPAAFAEGTDALSVYKVYEEEDGRTVCELALKPMEGYQVLAMYAHATFKQGDFEWLDAAGAVFYTEEDTNGDGVPDEKANYLYLAALDYTGDGAVGERIPVPEEYAEDDAAHVLVYALVGYGCRVVLAPGLRFEDLGLRYDQDRAKSISINWTEIPVPEFYIQDQYAYGMKCLETENYQGARICFQPAAAAGHAESAYWLGYIYENGLGVERDEELAAKYYQMAKDGGYEAPEDDS